MSKNKQPTQSIRRHRPVYKIPLFWVILVVVLGIGGFFGYRLLTKEKPSEEKQETSISKEEKTTRVIYETPDKNTTTKPTTNSLESSSSSSTSPDGKTPEKYDGNDPNFEESLTGSITTARIDEDKLIIRVTIDQYLSNGTCSLTITNGDQTLEKTANIAPIASTSSCEGFDVPTSELNNINDNISIKINITSGDKIGTITGEVE